MTPSERRAAYEVCQERGHKAVEGGHSIPIEVRGSEAMAYSVCCYCGTEYRYETNQVERRVPDPPAPEPPAEPDDAPAWERGLRTCEDYLAEVFAAIRAEYASSPVLELTREEALDAVEGLVGFRVSSRLVARLRAFLDASGDTEAKP